MTFQTLTWLIGLLFLTLKLFGIITWPWVWVIMPFLVVPIFYILFCFVAGMTVALARS